MGEISDSRGYKEVLFLVSSYFSFSHTTDFCAFLLCSFTIFFILIALAEILNDFNPAIPRVKSSIKTLITSDRRLRRRKRLNVKFREVMSDLDDEDENVEVVDSSLHLLKLDSKENDSVSNSVTSFESSNQTSMSGKVISPHVEQISMKPKLEKSKSVPNFFFETPLMTLIRDLTFVKGHLDGKPKLIEIVNNVLKTLKRPETLTKVRRISAIEGLDETWCHFTSSYSNKPYERTSSKSSKLFSSKSFRFPTYPSYKSIERTQSYEWLTEEKDKRLIRTNSDSASVANEFTWLPSLVVGKQLNNWDLDVFALAEETGQRPLTWLLVYIAEERNWFETFSIDRVTFINFCKEVELNYNHDVPYHNHCHAADVVNSTYYLYAKVNFASRFDELAFFSGIIAAAIHDLNHPGRTARFLIHTKDPLALRYNDFSILENMHLAEGFSILSKPECNIVGGLSPKEFTRFRELVIKAVLSTDLVTHLQTIRDIKQCENTLFNPVSEESHVEMIMSLGIKLADVGHASKCKNLHAQWSDRIQEEFFTQGDEERRRGLDVSKHMDRNKPDLAENQLGFFKYVALPLFQAVVETTYCPEKFVPLYEQMLKNEKHWLSKKNNE